MEHTGRISIAESDSCRLLILQATTFCNIDCSYCYLAERQNRSKQDPQLAVKVCRDLDIAGLTSNVTTVLWHSGEPLTAGINYFKSFFEELPRHVDMTRFEFAIQTNGLLLNEEWIELFAKHRVAIGLSLDGPEHINDRFRVNRKGRGVYQDIRRAAELIKSHDIELNILCVLSDSSFDVPDEIFHEFESIGADLVSFNVQEMEGVNKIAVSNQSRVRYQKFLQAYYGLLDQFGSSQRVRELESGLSFLFIENHLGGNLEIRPFDILSVGADGSVSTFSPELHAVTFRETKFSFGNVSSNSWIEDIRENALFHEVRQEILAGVQNCKNSCDLFDICWGGSPSNKWFENGSLSSTFTHACQLYKRAVADAAIGHFIVETA